MNNRYSMADENTELLYDEKNYGFSVFLDGKQIWSTDGEFRPYFTTGYGKIYFSEAEEIVHECFENGIGKGVRSRFCGFQTEEQKVKFSFELSVWLEYATGDVLCEWVPLVEEDIEIHRVYWPAPMEFRREDKKWYTLINLRQGLLIPNDWEVKMDKIIFGGRFGTAASYMPWFAQIKEKDACLVISETPWDAGYYLEQPEGHFYTEAGIWQECSRGKMDYKRSVRYRFLPDSSYNEVCKEYRRFAEERGRVRTLEEKAVRQPDILKLSKCAVIHEGIKTYVRPDSDFFDKEDPEKNNKLTSFWTRADEVRKWHSQGAGPIYLHLDGWAEPGYDNSHPDYYPVCSAAGGVAGMRALSDTLHEYGDLFGIHDQYRDYYRSACGFDEDEACRQADGKIPEQSCWAGGPQSYLCTTRAPYYVKRNFRRLKNDGITPDCAYLDVFTCNEGDECTNKRHPMSRRESYGYRMQCFAYLESNQILASSEEVNEWAVPQLIFCHYAPYDFMLGKEGQEKRGAAVPLFNLVYHDCILQPWMMDKPSEKTDYMLYALLNGGMPYLKRDGAYSNIDGAFESGCEITPQEQIGRCRVVSRLCEETAFKQMISHEFVNGSMSIQRTIFEGGIAVTVNLDTLEYKITQGQEIPTK